MMIPVRSAPRARRTARDGDPPVPGRVVGNAEADGNPGAYMSKRWFEYSKTGRIESGTAIGRSHDLPFEKYVARQVRSMGCEPVSQVGVDGYLIDIGVKTPHGHTATCWETNATVPTTAPPNPHVTATGCARRTWKDRDGGFTGPGPRIGSTTPLPRLPRSGRPSSVGWLTCSRTMKHDCRIVG